MTKRYWDYTEKERSSFTEEQVTAFLDTELMEQGILKPVALALQTVEAVETPTKTYYQVNSVCFETREQAEDFLKLNPIVSDYDYAVGYEHSYANSYIDKGIARITQVSLYDKQAYMSTKSIITKNNSAKKHNKEVTEQYDKECEALSAATNKVWDNWHKCQRMEQTQKKILTTREEYLRLTGGDTKLTKAFLLKVFTEQDLKSMENWYGIKDETKI